MPDSYDLPHLSFEQQAAKLAERGLAVADPRLAAEWLERIGYYRLRPYWTALEDEDGGFRTDASLADAVQLYVFDARLRNCLMLALERIEVLLRVQVSHAIGKRDVAGHRLIGHLDGRKGKQHSGWLDHSDGQIEECREQWLVDFRREYGGPVPTWMAVEAWSFGTVSRLYSLMHRNDRASIAKKFATNPETFASWMRACATARNSCAHHNRVWNKPLIDQPAIPKTLEAKPVQHISVSRHSQTRIYSLVAIAAYLQGVMGHGAVWKKSMKTLVRDFPAPCGLSVEDAGFPADWAEQPLWN